MSQHIVVTDYNPLTFEENQVTAYDTVRVGDVKILYGKNGRSIRPPPRTDGNPS